MKLLPIITVGIIVVDSVVAVDSAVVVRDKGGLKAELYELFLATALMSIVK